MLNIFRRVLKKNKEPYFITSIEDLGHVKDCLKSENIFCIDTEFDWRTTRKLEEVRQTLNWARGSLEFI